MSTDAARSPQQIGNYDLISKIAEGGMGAVYKGRNRSSGQIVAIKIVPTETARNPLLLKRFEQEFKAASLIDHPNVVKALDYCGTGPSPFLVMEFVDGESLGQRVERAGPIPEPDAVRIISQVCEGLHRAHKQGLIHRDVKPDNILVTHEGGIAKLTDLGLVKDVEGEMNLTRTGRGLGTPHFMAPEQFRNAKNADVRCDVYSLGATLYTMLTGVVPFAKTSPLDCWMKKTKDDFPEPRKLNPKLSERVNWAICRAMRSDATARPASCREFMEDLTGTVWKAGSGLIHVNPGPGGDSAKIPSTDDLWYMVYRDENGQPRTVKGTTDSIRKNVQAGALGDLDAILVGRTKGGQFHPLKSIPEFRDLVVSPSGVFPPVPPEPPSRAVPTVPPSGINPGGSGLMSGGRTPTRLPTPGSGATRATPPSPGTSPPARPPSGPVPTLPKASSGQIPTVPTGGNRDPLPPLPGSGLYSTFHEQGGRQPGPPPRMDMVPIIIGVVIAVAGLLGGYLLFK